MTKDDKGKIKKKKVSRPPRARVVNGVTNREFAKDDVSFNTCCERAGLEPTKRQASKWRRGKGKAYSFLSAGANS